MKEEMRFTGVRLDPKTIRRIEALAGGRNGQFSEVLRRAVHKGIAAVEREHRRAQQTSESGVQNANPKTV